MNDVEKATELYTTIENLKLLMKEMNVMRIDIQHEIFTKIENGTRTDDHAYTVKMDQDDLMRKTYQGGYSYRGRRY